MLLLPAALAAPLTPADVPSPRPRSSWVADLAEVIPPDAEARIDAKVDALQRDLTVEIAVVSVRAIDGNPKEFATELFNRWGIGSANANNGALVLLVVDARRVEIEVGYGLEATLPDSTVGALLDQHVLPYFRAGDFGAGLEAAVDALDASVRRDPASAAEGTGGAVGVPGGGGGAAASSGGSEVDGTLVAGGAAGTVVVGGLGVAWMLAERRRRQCPVCKKEMLLLDEQADDAHLSAGQRAEERVGSVNYEVRTCQEHDVLVVIPRRAWFSGYGTCGKCKSRTSYTRSRTLTSATRHSEGLAEVTTHCEHCGFHAVTHRTIPRLPPPQSTSSSGGSFRGGGGGRSGGGSFGGGRSGGGGAGRSF